MHTQAWVDLDIRLFLWLGISALLYFAITFYLVAFLGRRGGKSNFMMISTPGYMDMLYAKWCKENNKSSVPIIVIRALLLLSIVLAAIAVSIHRNSA